MQMRQKTNQCWTDHGKGVLFFNCEAFNNDGITAHRKFKMIQCRFLNNMCMLCVTSNLIK